MASPVIVIGGGLSGLTAAVAAAEAGAQQVTLLEREPKLGGNSAKASFGIAAVAEQEGDTAEAFVEDILASGGGSADPKLARLLAEGSTGAISWLSGLGLKFEEAVRPSGARAPRVRRTMGFQLVGALGKRLESFVSEGRAAIVKEAKVSELLMGPGGVCGVRYETPSSGGPAELRGAVVLCSGGFSANASMLGEGRASLAITQGPWTVGEGARLAQSAGCELVGAGEVQVHPTGFVDPKEPAAKSSILASEALRQAGAVLINGAGRRFCDERRDTAAQIVEKLGSFSGDSFVFQQPTPIRILFPPEVAESEAKHCGFYISKGLLKKFETVGEMAKEISLDSAALAEAMGLDTHAGAAASTGPVLVGEVAPAVHYSLGGIRINEDSQALAEGGRPIAGLFAAGEAAGGIHGQNRLAGNGLLESVVFGRVAGARAVALGGAV